MCSYKPIESIKVMDDSFLLVWFKKEIEKVKFIRDSTDRFVLDLRDNELHLQTDKLIRIWERLIADAIIFLKSKDRREKYHDQMTLGTEMLFKFLREFEKFEPILYGAVPNYRDHIAHVFRVFLLGLYVIKKAIGFENIKPNNEKLVVSPEEKEALWCITALTHDLGIPLEQIQQINQHVRGMLQQFGNVPMQELGYSYFTQFGNISEFVVKFMSSDIIKDENGKFVTHLQAKYYQKFLSALGDFNHGVMSSIILMKNLVYFKESDFMLDSFKPLELEDARQFLIRKVILRAIASHSCEDIYYLEVKNFPFLLTVFDELQEWGRPRLVDVTKRGGSTTGLKINKFNSKIVDYKITFSFPKGYPLSDDEKTYTAKEVKKYFVSKCKKWLNVLRSAVGGDKRDLKLNFEVEDNTSEKVKNYWLKHRRPDKWDTNVDEIKSLISDSCQVSSEERSAHKPDDKILVY